MNELNEKKQEEACEECEPQEMEVTQDSESANDGTSDAEGPHISEAELSAMMAAAEQRGYLRGRNEIIEQMMREPPLFSNPSRQRDIESAKDYYSLSDASVEFLAHIRPQVWD